MSLRARIAEGDREALAEAFVLFRPLALKVLRGQRRSPADFDDLIQDAFMLLPAAARKCSPLTSLGGCVATAVIRACGEWDGRKATHGDQKRREWLDMHELERLPDIEHHPAAVVEQRERVHHLSLLVEQLPPRHRDALIAQLRGDSPRELAERFGPAVKHTMYHARTRLEALAAASPLAEVFASMPRRGQSTSRSAQWHRRQKELARAVLANSGSGTRGGSSPSGSFALEVMP